MHFQQLLVLFTEYIGEIRECPWHGTMTQNLQHYTVAHLIGVDDGNGKANVIGYIGSLPLHTHLILIHIIPEAKLVECSTRMGLSWCPLFDSLSSPLWS